MNITRCISKVLLAAFLCASPVVLRAAAETIAAVKKAQSAVQVMPDVVPFVAPASSEAVPLVQNQVVEGDIFIIPNSIYRNKSASDIAWFQKHLQNTDLTTGVDDVPVEIWATSRDEEGRPMPNTWITAKEGAPVPAEAMRVDPGQNWRNNSRLAISLGKSDNWTNHGHPLLWERFPRYLPARLFTGKKEGDVITFKVKNPKEWVTVSLRLQQNTYRYGYGRYGKTTNFEDMLARLMKSLVD